jgi:hypothetical protein
LNVVFLFYLIDLLLSIETLQDFLLSLQHGAQLSGRHFDARQWSREWLCTAGLNTLTPKYSVNNTSGLIEDFVIIQVVLLTNNFKRTLRNLSIWDTKG